VTTGAQSGVAQGAAIAGFAAYGVRSAGIAGRSHEFHRACHMQDSAPISICRDNVAPRQRRVREVVFF